MPNLEPIPPKTGEYIQDDKFLGKYDIEGRAGWDCSGGGDHQIVDLVNSLQGEKRFSVSKTRYPNELQINSVTQLGERDWPNFAAHIALMRSVYQDLILYAKTLDLEDAMHSKNVLEPWFKIRMVHQGFVRPAYTPESAQLYHDAYSHIIQAFGGDAALAPDYIHEKQAFVKVQECIGLEMPKMEQDFGLVTFTLIADEHADYSLLQDLSQKLIAETNKAFDGHMSNFTYEGATSHFRFDIDLWKAKELTGPGITRFLEKS